MLEIKQGNGHRLTTNMCDHNSNKLFFNQLFSQLNSVSIHARLCSFLKRKTILLAFIFFFFSHIPTINKHYRPSKNDSFACENKSRRFLKCLLFFHPFECLRNVKYLSIYFRPSLFSSPSVPCQSNRHRLVCRKKFHFWIPCSAQSTLVLRTIDDRPEKHDTRLFYVLQFT